MAETLADRLEEHLRDEADGATADEWMPWVRKQTPQIDDAPAVPGALDALLKPLEEAGCTIDAMQWAAHEKQRAEEEGLTTQREWIRDYMERRLNEGVVEEAWSKVAGTLPPMQDEMDVSDYINARNAYEEQMEELGLEHLDEIGRIDEGRPGRN